jgi:hypothetical protein
VKDNHNTDPKIDLILHKLVEIYRVIERYENESSSNSSIENKEFSTTKTSSQRGSRTGNGSSNGD